MRHYRWALLAIPPAPTLILSAPRAHAVMASASGPSPSTSAVADPSKFGYRSTAEDVTAGVDLSGKVAIVMALANSPSRANLVLVPMFSPRAHVAPLSFRRANFFFLPLSRHPCGANFLPPGGSSGIGTEAARVLALRGASVVPAVRNTEAGEAAKAAIIKDIEGQSAAAAGVPAAVRERVSVMPLDLASLKSVRAFAADYLGLNRPLHLLINNASVMICPFMLTAAGHENQFGTNHVGHFLLTNLLLPKLKETAKQEGAEARIVIVSSAAHQFPYPGGIRFDAINAKEGYDSVRAYGQSKLANILHARELARRLKVHGCMTVNALYPWVIDPSTMEKPPASLANTLHHPPSSPLSPSLLSLDSCEQEEGAGVTVNALHPGVIDTNLSRHIVPPGTIWHTLGRGAYSLVFQWFMKTIPQVPSTSTYFIPRLTALCRTLP
ncbi:unnamed protein product [Closterium sp. NIES-65]|nr:unnamed protein product [Closterium sp. NIES-65]